MRIQYTEICHNDKPMYVFIRYSSDLGTPRVTLMRAAGHRALLTREVAGKSENRCLRYGQKNGPRENPQQHFKRPDYRVRLVFF